MKNGEGEGEEVVEEKRKMERKRGRWRNQPPLSSMKVLALELRKKTLDTRQRLKTKVESAIKFSPPLRFCHGSATDHKWECYRPTGGSGKSIPCRAIATAAIL
jgi:hypothetical protein